jgi:hypothetical protein
LALGYIAARRSNICRTLSGESGSYFAPDFFGFAGLEDAVFAARFLASTLFAHIRDDFI